MSSPSQPGKGHVLAVAVAVATGGWLVAGCSAHVSVGGPSAVPAHTVETVPRQTVETQVATTLARQLHQPVPKVVCPADLKAEIGTVIYCSLTAQGSATAYPVKVQVYSISGSHVNFHSTVSQTPGHFTAPG